MKSSSEREDCITIKFLIYFTMVQSKTDFCWMKVRIHLIGFAIKVKVITMRFKSSLNVSIKIQIKSTW